MRCIVGGCGKHSLGTAFSFAFRIEAMKEGRGQERNPNGYGYPKQSDRQIPCVPLDAIPQKRLHSALAADGEAEVEIRRVVWIGRL